ncbi:MAG: class I SAM-dependent methyltransferase [Anaerolinea sp.]|nr:class I SAM-dependent methyltransferase [Anaerolinea sp.]MCC6972633.1 class I SAM-dependent methyltransferase [Anaerolineae bacterium]CAG1015286.1 putative S-adenosylmethionine-dependent methyltransferase/MSMEI_2290 [Anaerolineae bacterium]
MNSVQANGKHPNLKPQAPLEEYGEQYFKNYNYADRPLGRFSMYWFARRYYAALIRRYAPKPAGKLLELGCGLGHLIGLLQDDFQCVGIDLADYAIEETRKNAPRAQAFTQSADDLSPFQDGEFSVVVGLHLVEHLPDPAHTLREAYRILRPGGLLLFATPNPGYSLRRFKDPLTDAIGKDPTHINVQPPARWQAWASQSGFRVLRHFGDGLWDVPYLKGIPVKVQFALFGLPALLQVITQTTLTPLTLGVNQIMICRKPAGG